MQLSRAGYTVTIEHAHDYPYRRVFEFVQATELSGAGTRHVDHFQVQTNKFEFVFNLMPTDDYELILNFFISHAVGMRNQFELTDDLGATRSVRFLQSELDFKQTFHGLWSGKFMVEEVQS